MCDINQIWWDGIKSFPHTTSLHGFRFIADSERHWIERLFWTIFLALSWYGSFLLIIAQYDAFQNNPISFVVETTYKDWDTEFPSVAVCEVDNPDRIEEISDEIWGEEHDFNIQEVLKEIAYFKGSSFYILEHCLGEEVMPECSKILTNLTYFATMFTLPPPYPSILRPATTWFIASILPKESAEDLLISFIAFRSSCEVLLSNCMWSGKSFDCCKYFRPIDTELGVCYVVNSIQGSEKNSPKYKMTSNKRLGPGSIRFDVSLPSKIFTLNEEDVPTFTTIGSDVIHVGSDIFYRRYITIRNIENDAGARLIQPVKRKCRYADENILQVYPYYSFTACTVQCRKDAQMRMCNCSSFFMPNTLEQDKCNLTDVKCLAENYPNFSSLKASWSPRAGLYCDCLPSCTEAEISIVKDFQEPLGINSSRVHIELSALPSERYRRNVVRGVLDLVVSTGGTGGLFLGASLLSFVEFFYILLLRPFFDIYSRRNDDPWHRKYGNRKLEDSVFAKRRKTIKTK